MATPDDRRARLLAPADLVLRGVQLVLAIPVGYLTLLTGAAWVATARSRRERRGAAQPYLAVLVPAHDEANVIGETITALLASDYPRQRFEVRVLADHCSDDTAALAQAAGATVDRRDGGARGKGPTLAWAIERRLTGDAPVDAFVVVDADTVVARRFLSEIGDHLDRGARVVQGQYRVRDADRSPAAGLRAIALALRHHVRPLGRVTIGASCGLYGNGMAFAREVVAGRTWTNHLTEDIALQMELLLDGVLVAYAPHAIVEAEMPDTLDASRTQHERWERGRLDVGRRYVPALARRALTGPRRVAAADAVLDHVVPPLSVLVAAVGAVSLGGGAVSLLRRGSVRPASVALPAAVGAHIATGLALGRLPRSVYPALLAAPRMVVWKVAMWARLLVDRRSTESSEWIRTDHVGTAHTAARGRA